MRARIFGVLIGGFGCFMIGLSYIAILTVFAERKREKIVVLGGVALSATLLFFGFFFFFAGAWSIYFEIGSRPAGLEFMVIPFGILLFAAGILIVSQLVGERKRKWIIALGMIVCSLPFFYAGFFYLYSGAMIYLLLDSSVTELIWAGILGGGLILAGIIFVARALSQVKSLRAPYAPPKEERMDAYAPKDTYASLIPKGRFCKHCGKLVSVELGSCPNCGKELE